MFYSYEADPDEGTSQLKLQIDCQSPIVPCKTGAPRVVMFSGRIIKMDVDSDSASTLVYDLIVDSIEV